MATIRINFGVSQFMLQWIKTQPNIIMVESSDNQIIIQHNMSGAELLAFKNNFIDRLAEVI